MRPATAFIVTFVLALFFLIAGCGAPDARVEFIEETITPPAMCSPQGQCPPGLMCADDNHCGAPCGVNFACSLGWACYAFGPGHVNHDCVPQCYFTDGGCPESTVR